jgi:hypothetical protein
VIEHAFDLVVPLCQNGVMADQLRLIESDATDWQLDERTRESGRRGVEAARRALRAAATAVAA